MNVNDLRAILTVTLATCFVTCYKYTGINVKMYDGLDTEHTRPHEYEHRPSSSIRRMTINDRQKGRLRIDNERRLKSQDNERWNMFYTRQNEVPRSIEHKPSIGTFP